MTTSELLSNWRSQTAPPGMAAWTQSATSSYEINESGLNPWAWTTFAAQDLLTRLALTPVSAGCITTLLLAKLRQHHQRSETCVPRLIVEFDMFVQDTSQQQIW